jgi:hypothetical protein
MAFIAPPVGNRVEISALCRLLGRSIAGISFAIALAMRNLVDELASIVNFGALSGFLLLHISVLAKFAIGQRSKNWIAHWLVPLAGIAAVLAVFTGMSRLATELGISWLVVAQCTDWF